MLEIYTDGASRGNPGESAISSVFVLDAKIIYVMSESIGIATNNVAEYKAILKSMEEARRRNFKSVSFFSDSLLVVSQLNGIYKVKSKDLFTLYEEVKNLEKEFESVSFVHVARETKFIKIADYLCTLILGPK
ncbi:ribonuclease HI family protein [Caldisericum exile]|uniref:Ribonuclease n=1 Tax=Caldisericum exile (strain DSM 21853 / NBRC 104410 / AZM16c01) TaxID=511051 RepID=A0A7U6GEN2_CALEA|nr:ribonuclease HI family protein [Caldisericum exile]BAL81002.1 putative ribonuclease [Caldisericum exile AZM16c01]